MGLLGDLLGANTTSPIVVDKEYDGDRTTEIYEIIRAKIVALENEQGLVTCDKRILSLVKVIFIMLFRQNPF